MSSGLLSFTCACFVLWVVCLIRAVSAVPAVMEKPSEYRFAKAKLLFWANVGFVATASAVGLATLLPVILQVVMNTTEIQISVDFFYRWVIPVVGIGLIFLIGFYRLADLRQRRGSSMVPTLACCAPGIIVFGVLYTRTDYSILPSLICAVGAFSIVGIVLKFLVALFCREKIAGCFAHVGIVVALMSAGLSVMEQSIGAPLAEGESLRFEGWEFVYESSQRRTSGGVEQFGPRIIASTNERQVWLWPHRSGYQSSPHKDRQSRAAICTGVLEDVCVSFDGLDADGKAKITVTIRPFVFWFWLGVLLIVVGSAIGILERKARFQPAGKKAKRIKR
jgi:cytochrome c biogenesis factor